MMPGADTSGAFRGWRAHAGLFALFLALLLWLAWPTFRWPMVYDDLHLIRPFRAAELAAAFHGHWDPDGIETGGLRPLMVLFNHVRAAALGENLLAHRLLVAGLFSLYVALFVALASRVFRTGTRAALAGGMLLLANPHSVFQYVWLTDGVQCLQGLAFVGAAHLLLRGLSPDVSRPRGRVLHGLSGALVIAGALVREDTLVVVPVLLLFASGSRPFRYAAGLGLAGLALMGYRALVVPSAPQPAFSWRGLLGRVADVLNPVGNEGFDLVAQVFRLGGWAVLAGLVLWLAFARRPKEGPAPWRTPLLWLVCAVVACTASTGFPRGDLFLFASSFIGMAYATALHALSRRGALGRELAVAGLCWLALGGAYSSRAVAENFHPDSTVAIGWNGEFLYLLPDATIPEARRALVERRMAALGIHGARDYAVRLEELETECVVTKRRRPAGDGRVFVPRARAEGFPVGRPQRLQQAERLYRKAGQGG